MRLRRLVRSALRSPHFRVALLLVAVVCLCSYITSDVSGNLVNELAEDEIYFSHAWRNSSTGLVLDWREAPGEKRALFVYSAYRDQRASGRSCVRVVAIVKKRINRVECHYWSALRKKASLTGKVKRIRESWSLAYSAAFIVCPMPSFDASDRVVSVFVSTIPGSTPNRSTAIPVQDLAHRTPIGHMSVCIKPLHYEFNRALWLVEFIEMYILLGADRLIFYNHTVGPDVERVLQHYVAEGTVEVLPWSLPVKTQKEIRTEGIFASLNDCNLRSVGHFALTAMVDIDEFIFPRNGENLVTLVDSLGSYSSYIFKNVFFYLYWENDTTLESELSEGTVPLFLPEGTTPYLLTQTKTRRVKQAHKHGVRSKYLVRPEKVVEVGNHVVWEYIGGRRSLNVPEQAALSHHYRICEFGGFDCLNNPSVVDRTAHKFLWPLVSAVAATCMEVFPGKPACPPAPPLGSPW